MFYSFGIIHPKIGIFDKIAEADFKRNSTFFIKHNATSHNIPNFMIDLDILFANCSNFLSIDPILHKFLPELEGQIHKIVHYWCGVDLHHVLVVFGELLLGGWEVLVCSQQFVHESSVLSQVEEVLQVQVLVQNLNLVTWVVYDVLL